MRESNAGWFVGAVMECVRCGAENAAGAAACAQCTWPFSLAAWKTTSFWIRRVTLDTSCQAPSADIPELSTLHRWGSEGKLELLRAEDLVQRPDDRSFPRVQLPGMQPGLFAQEIDDFDGPDVIAGVDPGAALEEILFPDSAATDVGNPEAVERLRGHVLAASDVFVTVDVAEFLLRGRADDLRSRGIWVFTPMELVDLLRELYEWA